MDKQTQKNMLMHFPISEQDEDDVQDSEEDDI
jgi:hypothetical protein